MTKIWICGATGMLGSHFKRLLKKYEMDFTATGSKELNITHLDAVSEFVRVQRITHIINCAAYTQVDKAESEQKEAYQVNAIGPHHLGIAARRHGARVIHFSTDYVFDGRGRIPYAEDVPCAPIGAYGFSKLAGEVKLLEEHEESCIFRISWLFGLPGKNFVQTMLQAMAEKDELKVVSDQVGRPTYCQDVAELVLELLEDDDIYHIANEGETNWFEFAQEIRRQALDLGFPIKTKLIIPISTSDYPTPAKRPAYSTLSTRKIENRLGKDLRPWQAALNDYLIECKRNP